MDILKELQKCKDVKGNYSNTKIRAKANKELYEEIYKRTAFLDDHNPTTRERIYCIEENITEILRCPLTGKKLRYSHNDRKYNDSPKVGRSKRVFVNKFDHKKDNKDRMEKFWRIYEQKEYDLIDDIGFIIEKYEKVVPHESTNKGITAKMALLDINLFCSIIQHTKDFLGEDELKMSERIYCLKNNITEIPKDHKNRPLKFINKFKGYSVYANRKVIYQDYVEEARKQINENFTIKEEHLSGKGNQINRLDLICKECDYEFSRLFKNSLWKKIFCPSCHGYPNRSKGEDEIITFLNELGINNLILNNSDYFSEKGEIDIIVPDHKLAIEFNGILWHSFGTTFPDNLDSEKDKRYNHQQKMKTCQNDGFSLMTIFENEWNLKRDIVKSMIKRKLKIIENFIDGERCIFREIDKIEAEKFLEKNHIKGFCSCEYAFGLFHDNELITVTTFGRRKINRGFMKMELLRYCDKLGYHIENGLKHVMEHSKIGNFIAYADLRYDDGKIFKKLGFSFIKENKPTYYYTCNNVDLLHRSNFQKHMLVEEGEDSRKTEKEIMTDRGYRRIYDCGNLVFEYTNN